MKSLFRRLRNATAPPNLSDAQRETLAHGLPFLARLAPERLDRLHALVARFLGEKTITPLQGLELDDGQRLQLAGLACLPLLEFGAEGLHGWRQVLVYPGAFRVQRRHHDEDTGVVDEWVDELSGEAWDQGPLVLSWDDIQAELAEPEDGYQLVVHEMAHKIDILDGAMDGTPPLPADWQREWARDFQAAYEDFCRRVDDGEETPIDPYAAEAPEEFFAVASEYHFSAPGLLAQEMPAVARHLLRFYGESPIPTSSF
ncbi:M90 family metallopeptidase [uncultured Arenimonas sp.]|uniref:M90 family metallopeptidase n=1 Tax=uncultured Arenimonas sp. TaxID=546226 RepID=UPI0030D97578